MNITYNFISTSRVVPVCVSRQGGTFAVGFRALTFLPLPSCRENQSWQVFSNPYPLTPTLLLLSFNPYPFNPCPLTSTPASYLSFSPQQLWEDHSWHVLSNSNPLTLIPFKVQVSTYFLYIPPGLYPPLIPLTPNLSLLPSKPLPSNPTLRPLPSILYPLTLTL